MDRRNFLLTSAAASAAVLGGQMVRAEEPDDQPENLENRESRSLNKSAEAKLRLALYWRGLGIPAKDDDEFIKKVVDMGFEGIEVSGDGGGFVNDDKFRKIKDAGLQVCSVCFGSCGGAIVSEDEGRRQGGVDSLKRAIENAGKLGAKTVVYVPAFNNQTKLGHVEIRKVLMDYLPGLAKFAAEHGTNVVLEPLNRGEAWFLRQVSDAARIAMEADKDKTGGVGCLGDFYHMWKEEADDMGAFISGGKWVKHVHLGNGTRRTLPGQDDCPYEPGFRGLKYIGYNQFCSFECGVSGDDKEAEVRKSIAFLRSEWEKAEI